MKEQKKYHQRKLAIIEMIEECIRRQQIEVVNMQKFIQLPDAHKNSKLNYSRYGKIKDYLIQRY